MRTKPLMERGEYMRSLPRKLIGAGAIFLDTKDNILIVKPNYRDGWQIPGGTVDLNESPKNACIREVKEEIGLTLEDPELLCVRYRADQDGYGDGILFVFDGGTLTAEEIQKIVLQTEELDEYRFVPLEEAIQLVTSGTKVILKAALEASKSKSFSYIEAF